MPQQKEVTSFHIDKFWQFNLIQLPLNFVCILILYIAKFDVNIITTLVYPIVCFVYLIIHFIKSSTDRYKVPTIKNILCHIFTQILYIIILMYFRFFELFAQGRWVGWLKLEYISFCLCVCLSICVCRNFFLSLYQYKKIIW